MGAGKNHNAMTTSDINDYSWQFSPTLKQTTLWVQYYDFGKSQLATFTPEDVAGVMWLLGHCDGYTLKNGELLCEMDGRPGFGPTATPQEIWDTLHPEDKNKVALYLVIEKEGQQ